MEHEKINLVSRQSEQDDKISPSTYALGVMAILIASFFILLTVDPILRYYSHPLENAIARGDIKSLRKAIAKGKDVNAIDASSGRTMLVKACMYGYDYDKLRKTPEPWLQRICEMVEILLDGGANVNGRDSFGTTPLLCVITAVPYRHIFAGSEKHIELLAMLISRGADVNEKGRRGQTPLHCVSGIRNPAYPTRQLKVAELLIKSGADVNSKDEDGKTPLKLAIERKQKEIAELLRQHGAKE